MIFDQIRGFGEYGFPESHAASFALLVYVSAWLKRHHPAAFAAALLNSQPMGFYAPAQLVRDARQHGVEVRPVDVNRSDWDCTLEPCSPRICAEETPRARTSRASNDCSPLALRLGLRIIGGLGTAQAERIVAARGARPFASIEEFTRRTALNRPVISRLAKAGAFTSLGLDRRGALWHALAQSTEPLPLFDQLAPAASDDRTPPLPPLTPTQETLADYRATGLSLENHPMKFLRAGLDPMGVVPAERLKTWPQGRPVRVAGIVLVRQRPGTAKGITFVTLEDESGTANLIIRADVWQRFRRAALGAKILLAHGRLQRQGLVIHVLVSRLENLSDRMQDLASQSRDFC